LLLTEVRERLTGAGLLAPGKQNQLLPGRDPASISLEDVFVAIRGAHDSDIYQGGKWPTQIDRVFKDIHDVSSPVLSEQNLYQLVDAQAEADSQTRIT